MKLSLSIGFIVSMLAVLIGFLLKDYNITFKITGGISVISLIILGILNGTFISGDKYRTNLLSETKEESNKKMRISGYLLLFTIPNVVVAIIVFANFMK